MIKVLVIGPSCGKTTYVRSLCGLAINDIIQERVSDLNGRSIEVYKTICTLDDGIEKEIAIFEGCIRINRIHEVVRICDVDHVIIMTNLKDMIRNQLYKQYYVETLKAMSNQASRITICYNSYGEPNTSSTVIDFFTKCSYNHEVNIASERMLINASTGLNIMKPLYISPKRN